MTIRPATANDIDTMIKLGEKIYTESRFSHLDFDRDKIKQGVQSHILHHTHGTHLALVAQNTQGEIVGGFFGVLEEYFFTTDKSANSVLIWVDPNYRGSSIAIKLIDVFKQWAIKNGAKEINIVVSSGVKIGSTDRFVRRLGFVQTGGNYSMVLK
jgi:GNAT superfamily N-acetyltransferase